MKKKRIVIDKILNTLTYLSSGLSVVVLGALLIFIFSKGIQSFNIELLFQDYNAQTYRSVIEDFSVSEKFANINQEGVFYSNKWGVGFVDEIDEHKSPIVLVEYVDENSPFMNMVDSTSPNNKLSLQVGQQIDRIVMSDPQGNSYSVGFVKESNAQDIAKALDQAYQIEEVSYRSIGGGFRGSFVATFYLIVTALILALPLGIAAAIYLQEYARKNKFTAAIQSMIEMLTGVPSIVFGLMGVSVLYPVTQLFGATTSNVLLGAMTLAIIILPTIIRNTQEAIMVVPSTLKDASLALGANESQTIFKVILPNAIGGILTGVLLSVGRIIGESAALIYTMGTVVVDHPTLISQGTSMAVHIYKIMSGEQPNFELACAISMVILIFVLILNISVKFIAKKFQKVWR